MSYKAIPGATDSYARGITRLLPRHALGLSYMISYISTESPIMYNSVNYINIIYKREPAKMSCVVARGGCAHFCYVSVVFMTTHRATLQPGGRWGQLFSIL